MKVLLEMGLCKVVDYVWRRLNYGVLKITSAPQ